MDSSPPGFADLPPALLLTLAFALALLASLALKLWLATRQIRHVARHRGAVPPAFAARVGLAAHQKAADYTVARARLALPDMALGAAVALGWTLLGGLDALNQALLGLLGPGAAQQLALLAAFAALGALIDLPLSLYRTFGLEQRFGFNRITPRLWLADALKGLLLAALIGLPLAALLLWLMAAAGPLWWLLAWGCWMGLQLLLMVLYPTLIAPLFNRFEPLQDEVLKTRVSALMRRCGFFARGLFVMDGSRRSAHANAYFTGLGAAKRVVFFDTLLRQLGPAEVEAVLAHELGHFKHRHVLRRVALLFALSLAGFALLGWLANQVWFYTGLGVQPALALPQAVRPAGAPDGALALVLFLLLAPPILFFAAPLFAWQSRRQEFQADAYAAAQASAADLCTALLKLHADNASTLTPDPVYVRFHYSHPPPAERLARLHAGTCGGAAP